jgi:hypothetical protein
MPCSRERPRSSAKGSAACAAFNVEHQGYFSRAAAFCIHAGTNFALHTNRTQININIHSKIELKYVSNQLRCL